MIKATFLFVTCLISLTTLAQRTDEAPVLQLSQKVFQWEVSNHLDSLAAILDERLVVVGSDGSTRSKDEYLQRLSNGNFVHNNIEVEDSKAIVAENTAVVAGKGRFTVTSAGNKNTLHLSYMEVFIRPDFRSPWKLLAIKASTLPN